MGTHNILHVPLFKHWVNKYSLTYIVSDCGNSPFLQNIQFMRPPE